MISFYHRFFLRAILQVKILTFCRHQIRNIAVALINFKLKFQYKGLKITPIYGLNESSQNVVFYYIPKT